MCVVGLVVLVIAVVQMQEQLGLASRRWPFWLPCCWAAVMIYCFWLMLTTTAFWIVRVDEMVNLFEGMYAAGRWPVGIYPSWLRLV